MAHCCNCGMEIPESDRTKLCDACKKIILPFVKFMDASTSSAVRRLVTNEKNLRRAGVTDSGMDYLLRICELHDKKKQQDKQARELAKLEAAAAEAVRQAEPEPAAYLDAEVPMDVPLNLSREPYGTLLPAAEILLYVAGAVLLGWSVVSVIRDLTLNIGALAGGVASLFGGYTADVVRRLVKDMDELKKHFR